MRKPLSIISASLLMAFLMIPIGRGYAGDNPPGNHKEREALRRDQRDLEQLRRQRNRELREGDRREAREYNEKIRDKQREIRDDRRKIYGDNYGWWDRRDNGWRGNSWWGRHDRGRNHDYD